VGPPPRRPVAPGGEDESVEPPVLRELGVAGRDDGGTADVLPLDANDPEAVAAARDTLLAQYGRLDGLVLAAGLNRPARRWDDQSLPDFRAIVDTNLTAVVTVVDAALPALRESGGIVVVVSSYAGWSFQPAAGVAYSASKTALGSVVRTLNQQEAGHGVRATHLCPGDVATDFLDQRPSVPDAAARAVMLQPEDIARSVSFVLEAPSHMRVDELVVSPVAQR
ncbi:SDR family oxidoreductase, partial [Curtobacterium sp. CT11-45]|uniref:SDR family oxidoreductase n=1 Tax=Curtobacterium sp. CT11-45 TaxID=3243037 RepID=UPI0039AF29FA